ncbi:hypothetical protein Peur_026877 [Populus x canadensis]
MEAALTTQCYWWQYHITNRSQHLGAMVALVTTLLKFFTITSWLLLSGFTGLEFAGAIPRTVGGAACMNTGAIGQGSRTARIRQQEDSDRRRTQPLSECSAGSVFTNPSEFGVAAAELIEKKVSE